MALSRVTSQARGRVHVWSSEPSGRYLSASLGPGCPLRGDVTDEDSLCSHSPLVCRSRCWSAPFPVIGPVLVVPNRSSLVQPRLVGHLVLAVLCCGSFLRSGPGRWYFALRSRLIGRAPCDPISPSVCSLLVQRCQTQTISQTEKFSQYIDKKTPSVTGVDVR